MRTLAPGTAATRSAKLRGSPTRSDRSSRATRSRQNGSERSGTEQANGRWWRPTITPTRPGGRSCSSRAYSRSHGNRRRSAAAGNEARRKGDLNRRRLAVGKTPQQELGGRPAVLLRVALDHVDGRVVHACQV